MKIHDIYIFPFCLENITKFNYAKYKDKGIKVAYTWEEFNKYCTSCGKEIMNGAASCVHCGKERE